MNDRAAIGTENKFLISLFSLLPVVLAFCSAISLNPTQDNNSLKRKAGGDHVILEPVKKLDNIEALEPSKKVEEYCDKVVELNKDEKNNQAGTEFNIVECLDVKEDKTIIPYYIQGTLFIGLGYAFTLNPNQALYHFDNMCIVFNLRTGYPRRYWLEMSVDYYLKPENNRKSYAYGFHINIGRYVRSIRSIDIQAKVGLGYLVHQEFWEDYNGKNFWNFDNLLALNFGIGLEYSFLNNWGIRGEGRYSLGIIHFQRGMDTPPPSWMTIAVGVIKRF